MTAPSQALTPRASLLSIARGWWLPLLRYGPLLGFVALWAKALWSAYAVGGLFRALGYDWSLYYAQAIALRSGDPTSIYNLAALSSHLQVLVRYAHDSARLYAGPVPYPPLFAWLFIPFTLLPPPVGFAL